MIIAVFFGFIHINQQPRQIVCVRRRADLIVDHANRVVGFPDIQHRLDEILSIQAEYPRDADDEILLKRPADRQLTLELGLPIDVQRPVIPAIRLPRFGSLSVKHVIRADVCHLAAQLFAGVRHVLRASHIDRAHLFRLFGLLCQIHRRPRRAMDHSVRLYVRHDPLHSGSVGNIQRHIRRLRHRGAVRHAAIAFLNVRSDAFMAAPDQLVHHVVAELAANARHKKLHALTSAFALYISS